ncbi:hypothetical protein GCM10025883_11150 [Mobilicoccus caccae]|uniref:Uncharacterized protein n=1 Tax=Mobilicoccus caccae TaxID=1859295 RepID=A0ABQ6IMA7_9MICO|nr:hypothetical protein GCM10025883_11150 [Mobilicoccus caccae]
MAGEVAVAGDHGVDVGGVEERDPGRESVGDGEAQGRGVVVAGAVLAAESGEVGQDAGVVNQRASSAWWTRTQARVVGRRTPLRLTTRRARVLTRVDLPAPVEPPTTASRGASMSTSLGMM